MGGGNGGWVMLLLPVLGAAAMRSYCTLQQLLPVRLSESPRKTQLHDAAAVGKAAAGGAAE